jgi:hypothetical protein
MSINWKAVAGRDRELRQTEQKAGEQLGKLRYDNTIAVDVTFAEYARQCGVGDVVVAQYAHAWEIFSAANEADASASSFSECLARAKYSSEQFAALDAVAKARGVSHETARSTHSNEVRRVRQFARDAAEKRGTSVADEAAEMAKFAEQGRRSEDRHAAERAERVDFRYIEVERYLLAAKRDLASALRVDTVEFDDEMKQLLVATIDKVRSLLDLIALRFAGVAEVDWDSEMRRVLAEADES